MTSISAGSSDYRLMLAMHHKEWEAYHRIRDEQIFHPTGIIYDRNHPTLTAPNNYHFVLYRGTGIVSIAFIEFLTEKEAALRALATDEPYKNQGHATYLMEQLEKWVRHHGRQVLHLHAARRAESFYRRLGYHEMPFDDVPMTQDVIDLGKALS